MKKAFSLIELLAVVAIIAIVATVLFPAFSGAKARTKRAVCINHLKQLGTAIHMYLDDQPNAAPGQTNAANSPFLSWTDYRNLINNYVGLKGPASPQDKLFACPADTFFYDMSRNGRGYVAQPLQEQSNHAFTSYAYNAGQFSTRTNTNYFGIAGQRLETVKGATRTVLIAEAPAYSPYSWHDAKRPFSKNNAAFPDAKDMLAFVDTHVSYTKIYYDGKKIAWSYDPPGGYDYKWTGN